MPYTHDEPITNGPHFIVKTPNQNYSGEKLKVTFRNGIGRTRSAVKAKRFSDEFGYPVTPPPGVELWTEVRENEVTETFPELERENTVPVVEEVDD